MTIQANREFRDPVHGLIRLTDQEVRIIDQMPFQRLRRIKQLAMAHLVYPGALHTRFDHSLGTLHSAGRILDKVAKSAQMSDNDIRTVRLAALLHDIGHGPFSHVSEYLLEKYHKLPRQPSGTREKIHERITVDIIKNEPSIAGAISDDERKGICDIIQGSNLRDIRRDIVSSDLDADKMDYLSRDAYFTGVKYGVFDLDKVYDSFVFIPQGNQTHLGIEEAGIFATEQLILAKHHMTQQVYAHRVRVITDYMIVRGLELAIEDGLDEIYNLYAYDASPEFCQNYVKYHDDRLVDTLVRCKLSRPQSIYGRLTSRRLYKQLAGIRLNKENVPNTILRSRYVNLTRDSKDKLQELIAEHLGCESWEVIVEVKNVANPAYQVPGVLGPESILVKPRHYEPHAINERDELVVGQLPSFDTLHIIAPYEWTTSDINLEKLRIEKKIREILDDYVGGPA